MALWQKGAQPLGAQVEWPAGTWWEVVKAIKNATTPPVKGAYYKAVVIVAPDPRDTLIASLQAQLAALQAGPAATFNPTTRSAEVTLHPQDFEYALIPTT